MANPVPQFHHLVSTIRDLYPDFAYLHIVEPRIDGVFDRESVSAQQLHERDMLATLWAPKLLISAGGYDRAMGLEAAEKTGVLVAYGRLFISNVSIWCLDLVEISNTSTLA